VARARFNADASTQPSQREVYRRLAQEYGDNRKGADGLSVNELRQRAYEAERRGELRKRDKWLTAAEALRRENDALLKAARADYRDRAAS